MPTCPIRYALTPRTIEGVGVSQGTDPGGKGGRAPGAPLTKFFPFPPEIGPAHSGMSLRHTRRLRQRNLRVYADWIGDDGLSAAAIVQADTGRVIVWCKWSLVPLFLKAITRNTNRPSDPSGFFHGIPIRTSP